MIRLRYIPPAGTAISAMEITGFLLDTLRGNDRSDEFCENIKNKFGIRHCFLVASARAALAMLFSMLKQFADDDSKNEVLLPGYTCYSVPAAAEIAGLKIRVCDIDKETLSYDLEKLEQMDLSHTLAIVSANLFGNPDNLEQIQTLAKQRDIVFIDDAAQAMNARIGDRFAGTFGDIGIFSLDKGKNITTIQGGIIVTNDDTWASRIAEIVGNLPRPSRIQRLSDTIKLLIYSILLKPWLYWIPAKLPFLGLGKTIYTTDYIFTRYASHLASIANRLFERIDSLTQSRCQNVQKLLNSLKEFDGFTTISIPPNGHSACLRLPVLIHDQSVRDSLLRELNENGIGVSTSYPESIVSLHEVEEFFTAEDTGYPNSLFVARHILTIPTISYLGQTDIQRIVDIFGKHLPLKK